MDAAAAAKAEKGLAALQEPCPAWDSVLGGCGSIKCTQMAPVKQMGFPVGPCEHVRFFRAPQADRWVFRLVSARNIHETEIPTQKGRTHPVAPALSEVGSLAFISIHGKAFMIVLKDKALGASRELFQSSPLSICLLSADLTFLLAFACWLVWLRFFLCLMLCVSCKLTPNLKTKPNPTKSTFCR